MAKLILRSDGVGKEFDLEKTGSLTVGRSPDCDIPITDSQASRRHCSVVRLQSGYEVSDLGSTNGTLVNSTLVKKQKLKHGDVIRIGQVEIAFDDPSSAGAPGEAAVGYLVHAKGERKGQRCELSAQRTTIGRKATNTIVIDDAVSSSYHCEIVRGLNGYTIRDLGSTNGTLVNGEMVTEAQLGHGARIRVGNTRFVFQDPAMAEIDLELAGAADEDEWGMMRDIDLAAVRKRNPATIVYAVLFVAIVGAAGYFLAKGKPVTVRVGEDSKDNLVSDGSFESAAPFWRAEPEGGATVSTSTQVKGKGSQSLEIRTSLPYAEAFFETRIQVEPAVYRLKGLVGARNASARLGILWVGSGLRRWATGPAATAAALSPVDLAFSVPPWANAALVGVRIEGEGGTVHLDDVSLVKEAGQPKIQRAKVTEASKFRFDVTDARAVDVFYSDAAILVGGRPVVRDAEGKDLDASGLTIKAEAQDAEHVLVTVEGAPGAARAGIVFDEMNRYLRDGFRAFTPKQAKEFHPTFPDEGVLPLGGVWKLLVGPSGRSFAVLAAADDGRLDAEARVDGRTRSLALLGPVTDGKFAFRCKVDLTGENQQAAARIAEALTLYSQRRWGEFVEAANRALIEYPFANPASRRQLSERIAEVNEAYENLRAEIDRHRQEYKDFRDQDSLDRAATLIRELETVFQAKPGEGARGQYLDAAKAEVQALDLAARQNRQTKAAEHTMIQAELLDFPEGRVYSAALQAFYIAEFLPDSAQAKKAEALLQQIAKDHPEVLEVLKKLGFRRRS